MNSIHELFAAWISLAAAYEGGSMPMNPPAEPVELARVEQVTGHTLSEDVRALYLIANGQIDPEDEDGSPLSHQFIAGLWFESIDDALDAREHMLETEGGEFFNPDLFPFLIKPDGSGMAVDLGGDDVGERGNVVFFRPDRVIEYHHAKSLKEFLTGAVESFDSLALHHVSNDPRLAGLRQ